MEAFSNICVIMILVGLAIAIWAVAAWAVITVIDYYKFIKRTNARLDKKD